MEDLSLLMIIKFTKKLKELDFMELRQLKKIFLKINIMQMKMVSIQD